MKNKHFIPFIIIAFIVFFTACSKDNKHESSLPLSPKVVSEPLFTNSIVSTTIDFIIEGDPDAFTNFTYIGQERKEMPGASDNKLFDESAYIFEASFKNGKKIEVWCHSSFTSKATAEEYVIKLCPRLGKLPEIQRDMLHHVVIHTGNKTAFSETAGRFFVLYADNMDIRISNNDLEETVFHESVHASIQDIHEQTTAWKNAQVTDGNFITDYAQSLPHLEDMPESAIFCYTMIKHPGRLSKDIETWVKDYIPNHLTFFKAIYE